MVSFFTFLFAIFRSGTKCKQPKQSNQEKKIVSDDWYKRPRLSLRHHMDWMRENIRRRANKVGSRLQVLLGDDFTIFTSISKTLIYRIKKVCTRNVKQNHRNTHN